MVAKEPHVRRTSLAGAFAPQLAWDTPRHARKRGFVVVGATRQGQPLLHTGPEHLRRRLRLLNVVVSLSFTAGGALFMAGALLSQTHTLAPLTCGVIYLLGGVVFVAGGWASFLQAVNARDLTGASAPGEAAVRAWRWWSYDPLSIGWLATFALLAGTVVFGVGLADAFLRHLSSAQADRLVWAPDAIGCTLFLISGHLSLIEVCRGRARLLPHDLGWWIVVVNQTGSVLFAVSAAGAYVCHATDRAIDAGVANWASAVGSACFCVAGIAQAFERPAAPVRSGRRTR